MLFSLLVPCYNAEQFITDFLENISKLNLPFDEVIFYDDASTDNTADILSSKGFSVIRGPINRGPGYARNQLAEAATGQYIHFHDIDDGLNPEYLVKTSAIAKSDLYDVILCNVDWLDARTKKILLSWKYSNMEINKNPIAYTISNPVGGINGLYKRTKFLETGGFNTELRIWEDADLHVKLAASKAIFYVIEEELSYALRYTGSASSNQTLGWLTRLRLLKEYYKKIQDSSNRREIGIQAQVTAGNLILLKQLTAAKEALKLSELCQVKVPYNNSPIWGILRKFAPKSFRIQLRLIQLKLAFSKAS